MLEVRQNHIFCGEAATMSDLWESDVTSDQIQDTRREAQRQQVKQGTLSRSIEKGNH